MLSNCFDFEIRLLHESSSSRNSPFHFCDTVFWLSLDQNSIIKGCNALVQMFRNLHIKHSFHMIFTYLTTIVEQDKRISMLQKWQKSIHDRNSFEALKIIPLSKLCLLICELALTLKLCMEFFWKNSRANLLLYKFEWMNVHIWMNFIFIN